MLPIKGIPRLTHRLLPCFNKEEKSGCQESTFFSNLRFYIKNLDCVVSAPAHFNMMLPNIALILHSDQQPISVTVKTNCPELKSIQVLAVQVHTYYYHLVLEMCRHAHIQMSNTQLFVFLFESAPHQVYSEMKSCRTFNGT